MVDLSATPDPKSLDQITAATGLGAFVIGGDSAGGGANWGQNIDEAFVTGLFQLPTLTGTNMLEVLGKALNMLPSEALQQWQQLFPGLDGVNWSDPLSIINAILSQIIPKPLMQSVEDFEAWVTSTYNAFQTAVNAFWALLTSVSQAVLHYTDWPTLVAAVEAAWTTFTSAIEAFTEENTASFSTLLSTLFAVSPTTGLNIQWASVMNQLTALTSLLSGGSSVTTSDWQAWWNTTLLDLGVDATDAASIAAFLSGNYNAATQSIAWFNQLLASLGVTSGTDVGGVIGTNSTMLTQITQIFNDEVVTPINAAVQKVKDAWTAISADVSNGITTGDWNPLLTALFGGTTVGTTIQLPAIPTVISTPVTSWLPRLFTDLTILFDLLHATYPAGSPSDTKTTTSGGKRTWWSAVADIFDLFNLSQGTSALAISGQTVGQAVSSASTAASAAQSTANTANTNAGTAQSTANNATTAINTNQSWLSRFLEDETILWDMLHITYPAGSPSDTATTTSGGKRTWYSAWADMKLLFGDVKSAAPLTDAAPTAGQTIQANTAAANTASTNASTAIANASAANTLAQGTVDGLYQAFSGGSTTGHPVSTVKTGASAIPASNVVGNTGADVAFGAVGAGSVVVGSASSHTASESHVVRVGDLGILAFVSYSANTASGATSWSTALTYDGNAMSKVTSVSAVPFGSNVLVSEVWWYKFPSAITANASKTVVATLTGTGDTSTSSGLFLNTESASGSKVKSFGTGSGGGGTTMSMTVPSSAGKLVVGSFFTESTSTPLAWGTFSQTQDYSIIGTGSAADMGFVVGHAAGASSLAFSDTTTKTQYDWLGLWVELSN